VSRVTRRLANNEFEGTWHKVRVVDLWSDCWYVSHFYVNTWLGDQLWSQIGGETANILWCRHWPEKLEYKEPDGLIYCHSLKKIFLEQNPKVPSSSLLSLHTLRLVARYVKPADVMDAGERNCMLFECIYTSPEREKSQAIFHSTKCHTHARTHTHTHTHTHTPRSSQVNLLFTHSKKGAPTGCIVLDKFRRFLTICSIECNNNVLKSVSRRCGVLNP